MGPVTTPAFTLRPALAADADWMVALRVEVMRADLERLGRWDPVRARQRFLDAYVPAHTSAIEFEGDTVGLIAVRPEPDAVWIEHFYLAPPVQGRGLGSAVLAEVLARYSGPLPFRLNVLVGSPARRLYERHGFRFDWQDDDIDVYLTTAPASGARPSVDGNDRAGDHRRPVAEQPGGDLGDFLGLGHPA